MAVAMAASKIVAAGAGTATGRARRDGRGARAARAGPGGEPGRWVREVKGILALALAGFGLRRALRLRPDARIRSTSRARWGRSGVWLGLGRLLGLRLCRLPLPAAAGSLRRSRLRARSAHGARLAGGWSGLAPAPGERSPGILARASDTLAELRDPQGRHARLGRSAKALGTSVGSVGTWIILLAHHPGRPCSSSPRPRSAACLARSAALDCCGDGEGDDGEPGSRSAAAAAPAAIRPPSRLRGGRHAAAAGREGAAQGSSRVLAEKGLAWQETFDFGKGGAQAFQLPAGRAAQAPPRLAAEPHARGARGQRRRRSRRSSQDFGVDGHIVQASPGPGHHLLRVRAGGRASR